MTHVKDDEYHQTRSNIAIFNQTTDKWHSWVLAPENLTIRKRIHTRLVTKTVGSPLDTIVNSYELLHAITFVYDGKHNFLNTAEPPYLLIL